MSSRLNYTEKLLGRSIPSTTNATQVYAPSSLAVVESIIVCNTTNAASTYSIYIDSNGTTYNTTTALYYGVAIPANTTVVIEFVTGIPMTKGGNIAVQAGNANTINFSIYGMSKSS